MYDIIDLVIDYMSAYKYKREHSNFFILPDSPTKGSREKKTIIELKTSLTDGKVIVDKTSRIGFLKYERYIGCSESCSEKMSYEIAKIIGIPCAQVELAKDSDGRLGSISYLFNYKNGRMISEHIDAKDFINKSEAERKEYYTIPNIKSVLDRYDESLFKGFLNIMVFDALVGETDRHEENWGVSKSQKGYQISPLYDNGCNLLREFKDKGYAEEFYSGKKDFNRYILKSPTYIYKEGTNNRYKHFELIEYLCSIYPNEIKEHIEKVRLLTDSAINKVVDRIPKELLDEKHKEYIKKYLKIRREILLKMIENKGCE